MMLVRKFRRQRGLRSGVYPHAEMLTRQTPAVEDEGRVAGKSTPATKLAMIAPRLFEKRNAKTIPIALVATATLGVVRDSEAVGVDAQQIPKLFEHRLKVRRHMRVV
jgi:hypothetical protein